MHVLCMVTVSYILLHCVTDGYTGLHMHGYIGLYMFTLGYIWLQWVKYC